jgi:L-alanine-DL-glutamate epimerase-like enolase superfamily enzyme
MGEGGTAVGTVGEGLVAEPMIEDVYITVSQEPKLGLTLDRDVIPDHIEDGEAPFDLPDERTSPAA